MRLSPSLYMVGSGQIGLSDDLDCHVYLIDHGGGLVLVDAGAGRDPQWIVANIRSEGLDERLVTHLLLTHSHADHAGGALALAKATGAEIVCSDAAGELMSMGTDEGLGLERAKRSGMYPQEYAYTHADPHRILAHGETLVAGGLGIRAILVPGHSTGSMCYLVDLDGSIALFSGDAVFHGGTIGLGNWAGSSLEEYRRCIGRLAGLGVQALLPGHFLWTLRGGQEHLDTAIENMSLAWVPPAWHHHHPHY